MEAYGSQLELISQGVNPAHLLGLTKEKEQRDEFLCKGDDDEDEDEKERDRNGGYVNMYEVGTNICLPTLGPSLLPFHLHVYFRPKSDVSPALESI